jgi:soluble lytic murein transglycosylase-like protein
MRLFVLTLAASALVHPALAHAHARAHHRHDALSEAGRGSGTFHGRRHVAYAATRRHAALRAWGAMPGTMAVGEGAWRGVDDRQAEHRPYSDPYGAPLHSQRPAPERFARRESGHGALDAMIARHAQMNGVPEALVHRVVIRESGYNPRAMNHGAIGLMQIKYATARAMGYTGSPAGLLDPETNLTYAVRYLAGAYQVAGGNANRAVGNYARGYYGAAKRAGIAPYAASADQWAGSYASAQPVEQVAWAGPPLWRHAGRFRHAY